MNKILIFIFSCLKKLFCAKFIDKIFIYDKMHIYILKCCLLSAFDVIRIKV